MRMNRTASVFNLKETSKVKSCQKNDEDVT